VSRRWKQVGAVIGTVTALAAFATVAARGRARSRAHPGSAGDSGSFASEPGQQRRWSLTLEFQLEGVGNAMSPTSITGDWVATVSAASGDELEVAYQLANARVSGQAIRGAGAADIEAWRDKVSDRFFVTYRADGAPTRLHFPAAMEPSARNLLQLVVTGTQLVRPARDTANWTTVERDAVGSYLAAYRVQDPGRIEKRKLKYVDVAGTAAGATPAVEIVRADFRFETDGAGAPIAFEGEETLRLGVANVGANSEPVVARMTIRLRDRRSVRAPELIGSLERARRDVVSSPVAAQAGSALEAQRRHDEYLLEGRSPDALLAAAGRASEDLQLGARLEALFRLRPQAIQHAVGLMRGEQGAKVLAEALGGAGTTAGQAALTALAGDRAVPTDVRVDAVTALARVTRPELGTLRAVGALLDAPQASLRRAAVFMAGALAATARGAHPTDASRVERDLVARYDRARDLDARLDLLAGLGNSAGLATLPPVRRALTDGDARIRAAAARALRRVEGETADELLRGLIARDRDPAVRSAAMFASSFRRIDAYTDALADAARTDAAEHVRTQAVRLLGQQLREQPQLRTTLAEVAARDPKPGVRRTAREALDRELTAPSARQQ
jgi:hypothetical protein